MCGAVGECVELPAAREAGGVDGDGVAFDAIACLRRVVARAAAKDHISSYKEAGCGVRLVCVCA